MVVRSLLACTLSMLFVAVASVVFGADACDRPGFGGTSYGVPDHQATGNRVVAACEAMQGTWEDIALEEVPAWVVAHPLRPGVRWVTANIDGTVAEVRRGGRTEEIAQLAPGEPPLVSASEETLWVASRSDDGASDRDRVPHGRNVSTGLVGARLAGPTDRYPHGVLGDGIEASALLISTDTGATPHVEMAQDEVIEGISAIAASFAEDGPFGFLVTVSDPDDGARLRAYDETGSLIAASDPIGTGFRWMHQIGVGPTGPDGEIEIIAVRTPHIGGFVEAYRLDGDRFERVAAIPGYSSHVIGSPNLDLALLADVDADGVLEVVVPTQAMTELAVLERTADGFTELARLPFDGRLASNVAAAVDHDGRLSLAAATDDGRLRVFR